MTVLCGMFIACDVVIPLGEGESGTIADDICAGATCGEPCSPCLLDPQDPSCSGVGSLLACDGRGHCVADPTCDLGSCGPIPCPPGTYCCNESCGLCVPLGADCVDSNCGEGGAGPCDPTDPTCLGEPCGITTCAPGSFCCDPACGNCSVPSPDPADPMEECQPDPGCEPMGEPCGENFCGPDQVCCNPSCGYCTAPGEPCPQEPCGTLNCNQTECGPSEVCCNFDCSICWPDNVDPAGCVDLTCDPSM